MRNFIIFFGMTCLLSVFTFADEKENLLKSLAQEQKRVALGDIREFHEAYKPLWPAFKNELEKVAGLSIETNEQLQTAQKRLAAVKLGVTKLEVQKVLEVVAAAYDKSQASSEEKAAALAKIEALRAALDKAGSDFDVMRVKLQLIGVAKKAHVSVGQASVSFYIMALKKSNEQLMAWWEKNKKSSAGLEKLKAIQKTLTELEPGAASNDKRQLEMLHMRLTAIDAETLGVFIQEP